MKRYLIRYSLCMLMMVVMPLSVAAQKEVRKNIRKGNSVYGKQKYSEAATFYQHAVEENPSSKEAHFNLGNTSYRQKEWDKSMEQYNHFISLEQENPLEAAAGWHNIGNAMLQKKELQKSMEAYKMALRLNPQDNETRYNLATVQKMIQDQEDQQDQSEGEGEQEQEQQEQQEQQQPQQPQDQNKEQRAEQPDQPEQMSRDNARQLLQAIEQDEQQTQEKVHQIKAQEREQQADDNKRKNKNW